MSGRIRSHENDRLLWYRIFFLFISRNKTIVPVTAPRYDNITTRQERKLLDKLAVM